MPDLTPDLAPVPVEPTPLLLIQQALDAKISPRDLKDLFDLQERHERNHAEKAYADAVTAFQASVPQITNTKVVSGANGQERYRYAPFEEIMRVITPHLRANRIVLSFDTEGQAGGVKVTCRVRVGTVEKCTSVVAAFQSPNKMMNETQLQRAAESYGKRGALCLALALVCTDEDTDAQPEPGNVTPQQQADITARLEELADLGVSVSLSKFCVWAGGPGCDSLTLIPAARFPVVMKDLTGRIAAKKQAEAARKAGGAA